MFVQGASDITMESGELVWNNLKSLNLIYDLILFFFHAKRQSTWKNNEYNIQYKGKRSLDLMDDSIFRHKMYIQAYE